MAVLTGSLACVLPIYANAGDVVSTRLVRAVFAPLRQTSKCTYDYAFRPSSTSILHPKARRPCKNSITLAPGDVIRVRVDPLAVSATTVAVTCVRTWETRRKCGGNIFKTKYCIDTHVEETEREEKIAANITLSATYQHSRIGRDRTEFTLRPGEEERVFVAPADGTFVFGSLGIESERRAAEELRDGLCPEGQEMRPEPIDYWFERAPPRIRVTTCRPGIAGSPGCEEP